MNGAILPEKPESKFGTIKLLNAAFTDSRAGASLGLQVRVPPTLAFHLP
jgi:hypothetical protein